jgi:hypothetical protein
MHFKTTDFYLAVTLSCAGFKIDALDPISEGKVAFCFVRESGLDKSIQSYWQRVLPIDAQTLLQHQRYVKGRLQNQLNVNGNKSCGNSLR